MHSLLDEEDEVILTKALELYREDDPDQKTKGHELRCIFSPRSFEIIYPEQYIDFMNPFREDMVENYEMLFTFIFNCIKRFNIEEFCATMEEGILKALFFKVSDSENNRLFEMVDKWNQLNQKARNSLIIEMLNENKIQKQNLGDDDKTGSIRDIIKYGPLIIRLKQKSQ